MKVVTVETLQQAIEDAQSGLDVDTTAASYVRMVYDNLPAAPLAEDVQAAVELLERAGSWPAPDELRRATATTIAALHAATAAQAAAEADRERLRAAGEKALDAVLADTEHDGITCTACGEGPEVHDDTCPFAPLTAALATTTTSGAGVVVVPTPEYERLKRMEERAIEVDVRLRKYTPGWDEVSYILHEEATDGIRPA